MGKQRQFVIERYKCTKCGQEMTVPRAMGKRRPLGHIKHMYCIRCKKVQPFIL